MKNLQSFISFFTFAYYFYLSLTKMLKPIKEVSFLKQLLAGEIVAQKSNARFPVLVLFENAQGENLPIKEEELLGKIMNGINIHLDSIKVLNIAYSFPYQSIAELPANAIISFGIQRKITQFPAYEPKYIWQNRGGYEFLFADSLQDISNSPELKLALWKAVKDKKF